VAGLLLPVVLFRFLLPLVLGYQVGSNDLRVVFGPWVIRRIRLDEIARARLARVSEILFAARMMNRIAWKTVFLEGEEGSSIYPGLLISPSEPEEFIQRLERARRVGQ
jgi:hypothetical protein